jgi:glycosyltransferase involved in cell wall biosynthesis
MAELDSEARNRRQRSPEAGASSLSRKLCIAMLAPCPFPTRQGTQVLIRHLAEALTRVGHEVHFVTYGYGEYEEDFSFHVHRAARVDTGLRSGPNIKKPAADAALVMTAARVARTYHCDLWHVHNVEGLGLGALLKLQTSLPLVYHAHSAMGPELPTYFRAHLAQAFASVLGEVLDRTLPKAADAVIAFDNDHKSLHEVYGVAEGAIHVIPPGLDGREIAGPPREEVDHARALVGPGPVLLYAGNPDTYQNLSLMWQAFARVRRKRSDVTLLVATNHPPEAFDAERCAAGNPGGVLVRRFKTMDELRAMFAVADIGLNPRTLWTGAPIKILNYLAAGLPVVACRSAARHILTPACGLMVDGNPEAFAGAILDLLEEPVGSAEARHRVFDKYRIDNQIESYEAVYRRVLGKSLS